MTEQAPTTMHPKAQEDLVNAQEASVKALENIARTLEDIVFRIDCLESVVDDGTCTLKMLAEHFVRQKADPPESRPSPAPFDEAAEREAFEAVYSPESLQSGPCAGLYFDDVVQNRWRGWVDRARLEHERRASR